MKYIGWVLLFISFNLFAQSVIINPPIELSPEDGKKVLHDAPVGALIPAKIDPVDGQLILGEKKNEEPSASEPALKAIAPREEEKIVEVKPTRAYSLEKYVQFSLGYLDSKWERADSVLDNGSTLTDFRIASDLNQHNQFGFAVEIVQDTSRSTIPENIRALQYKIFLDHHRTFFVEKLDWVMGIALSLGDYSVRKLTIGTSGEEVYSKIQSGTLLGIIPSLGLRIYFGGRNSIDIGFEYHQYLSKPQRFMGGLAFVPRFNFMF